MNAKTSSRGEEKASGTRNETLGEAKRGQVIRVAYVIAALDLTFLFMQLGVMPVSMGSLASQHISFNARLSRFPGKRKGTLETERNTWYSS